MINLLALAGIEIQAVRHNVAIARRAGRRRRRRHRCSSPASPPP
jgi:hypothetical protein